MQLNLPENVQCLYPYLRSHVQDAVSTIESQKQAIESKVQEIGRGILIQNSYFDIACDRTGKFSLIVPWLQSGGSLEFIAKAVLYDECQVKPILTDEFICNDDFSEDTEFELSDENYNKIDEISLKLLNQLSSIVSEAKEKAHRVKIISDSHHLHYLLPKCTGLPFPVVVTKNRTWLLLNWPLEKGHSKDVSICHDIESNSAYAATVTTPIYEGHLKFIQRESIAFWKLADNPRIIGAHLNVILPKGLHLMILDLARGDGLHFVNQTNLSLKNQMQIFYDIARALDDMHKKNVVHCDVKLENCLIVKEGIRYRAFLTDLAFVQSRQNPDYVFSGTLNYCSPEILAAAMTNAKNNPYIADPKRDIWALGCVFYFFRQKAHPIWPNDISGESFVENLSAIMGKFEAESAILQPKDCNSLYYLIWEMLKCDPKKRIGSMSEVVSRLELISDRMGIALKK